MYIYLHIISIYVINSTIQCYDYYFEYFMSIKEVKK